MGRRRFLTSPPANSAAHRNIYGFLAQFAVYCKQIREKPQMCLHFDVESIAAQKVGSSAIKYGKRGTY
jgi:hypothetical protein